jgi:hypothetical protein
MMMALQINSLRWKVKRLTADSKAIKHAEQTFVVMWLFFHVLPLLLDGSSQDVNCLFDRLSIIHIKERTMLMKTCHEIHTYVCFIILFCFTLDATNNQKRGGLHL